METSQERIKRRRTFSLVLSEYEMKALQEIASQEIRRPQEVVREMIRQEAQRRNLWPPRSQKEEETS